LFAALRPGWLACRPYTPWGQLPHVHPPHFVLESAFPVFEKQVVVDGRKALIPLQDK
jgi:hypothetical protein